MDLIIKPTEKCNFKCTFCSSTKIADDHTSILDLDYVYRFLKRYPNTNTIIVNGGDPLMMNPQYYWSIIDYLNENDLPANLSLTSNLWPFHVNPSKWADLFKDDRVGVTTSFQYGDGRLKGDRSVFTEEDFWDVSNHFLDLVGYRPEFIAVIDDSNEHTVLQTVELAKQMNVVCKVNYAMASGDQAKPYQLSKMYKGYVDIWKHDLHPWEWNTLQMMRRLEGGATTCPQNRECDSGIRALQPEGDYYSCGAFGDDREYSIDFNHEMLGGFITPLQQFEINSMKKECFSCPMFKICNGCKKTIKDHKRHNMVDDHCTLMKTLANDILKANNCID